MLSNTIVQRLGSGGMAVAMSLGLAACGGDELIGPDADAPFVPGAYDWGLAEGLPVPRLPKVPA